TLQYLLREVSHLVPRAGVGVALGGGVQPQRAAACAGRGLQDVHEVAGLVRVDLVEAGVRRVQAVLRRRLRVDRLAEGSCLEAADAVRPHLQAEPLREVRRLLDHPLADAPNNAGLAAGAGSVDDLRSGLIL